MQKYVIAYDIFDSKRRHHIAKIVDKYRLQGQKSSWEAPLDHKERLSLSSELLSVIEAEDKVNIISVVGDTILLGCAIDTIIDNGSIILL